MELIIVAIEGKKKKKQCKNKNIKNLKYNYLNLLNFNIFIPLLFNKSSI